MGCSTHAELMVPLGLASQRRDLFSTGTLLRPVLGGVASMGLVAVKASLRSGFRNS